MELLTKELEKRLREAPRDNIENKPLAKFFTPDAGATWLCSELLEDGDTMFCLADLGVGFPELGYVTLTELKEVRGRLWLPVERDLFFVANKTLEQYAELAREPGRIVL